MGDPGPKEGVVNGVDDARKAVRQRYKNGADWIKITATGGVLSVAKNGQNPQFTEEEIKAITTTAADYGMQVAAHAHGDEGMQRAIKNGVKTIEHGTLMSEETMDLMKEYNTYYVPTLSAGKYVAEKAKIEGYYPKSSFPKHWPLVPNFKKLSLKRIKRRGHRLWHGCRCISTWRKCKGIWLHGRSRYAGYGKPSERNDHQRETFTRR